MKTTGNTILITGGSAGIGLKTAELFSRNGNHVVMTGRNRERLQKAAAGLQNATPIVCDVTDAEEVAKLVERLARDFPGLNILINNAGSASAYRLSAGAGAFEKASEEILTNYLSIIRLTELLLPVLSGQEEAAIVNVSSIAAFVPNQAIPTYSASKAALHSYSQVLRLTLAQAGGGTAGVKVFELMPPLVDTEFSKGIGGSAGMAPLAVAEALMAAMEKDEYEIHVGRTAQLYQLYRSSPAEALLAMNSK